MSTGASKNFLAVPLILLAFGLLAVPAAPLSAVDPKTAQKIDDEIEKNRSEIIKIRRFIHMNPELSNREFETARLVSSKLDTLGLVVRSGIARTGVVALLRGTQPGPSIAVRADMDALPIQETSGVAYKSLNPGSCTPAATTSTRPSSSGRPWSSAP